LSENIKKVKNIKKIFSSAAEMVTDIVKNRHLIRKIFDAEEGIEYARKYFNKVVKEGNFDDWYGNTFKKYDLGEPLNFEGHHIIPVEVLESNPKLQELLLKYQDKFDFNSIDNGIPLQKKSLKYDVSGHANHPQYDDVMRKRIGEIMEDVNFSDERKFREIQDLVNNAKSKLETDVLLGNMDVNQITNF
jgi:hypothetical protein